jgi:dipeptidyl aminopeptidase/acylaminoacyl peptidase
MRRIRLALLCVVLFGVAAEKATQAGGVGVSSLPEAPLSPPIEAEFTHYRPGLPGERRFRDLEFQWSMLYTQALGQQQITVDERLTLDQLGTTLIERNSNAFGIPVPDIQLVYDYFRPLEYPDFVPYFYNPADPQARSGFVLGDSLENSQPIPRPERDHADVYIFSPGQANEVAGHYPSNFISANEDFSTSGCTSTGCVRTKNSLQFPGPSLGNFIDLTGTGWTRPDTAANWLFCHEFAHGLKSLLTQALLPSGNALDELFASGAEAIAGERDQAAIREVPYTWSLLGFDPSSACNPPDPECVRTVDRNYAAWRLFTAYLAYNFLGLDQSATLSAVQDDLLHKWATAQFGRSLSALTSLLNDSECIACPGYFAGLDDASRVALLLHNWRVANYVNAPNLPGTEGQYGYPESFQFTPRKNVGAWQDIDGLSWDNIIAIPPEIVLGPQLLTREAKVFGERSTVGKTYPMTLQPLGAEYWVVRADPALTQPGIDLVVHVVPESVFSCATLDGRLMASVVGYLPPDSEVLTGDLSANPSWAQLAVAPTWVDVDSLGNALELTLPGFGTAYKAALVVVSLAAGPGQQVLNKGSLNYIEALPYRLTLALRDSPFQAQNPQLVQDSSTSDSQPTWTPAGDEIAFTVGDGSTSHVYRRKLDGSPPVLVVNNGLSQFAPDWSPRGDQIVLTQGNLGPSLGDLYVLDLTTSQLQKLTGNTGNEACAVFRADGQALAYLHHPSPPEGPWSLRRIDVTGNNDALVYQSASSLGSPRWAPDGSRIYFVEGQTLHSIKPDGTDVRNEPFSRNVASFDVHPTGDSLAIAEPGEIPLNTNTCAPGASNSSQSFQRLVIFDQLGDGNPAIWDDPVRFYRTGAIFSEPRWSPEGTRVAYVSDQNGAADPDIFVGQVSFNHPPTFDSVPQDVTLTTCSPVTIDLDATDSDGEAVKYFGALMPATATLDSTTGVFTWNVPLSGDHYMVLRARDGSGGVAQKVVRISVPDSVRPDSLTVFEPVVTTNKAWIDWFAVGDDSLTSTACKYEVRRNSVPITEANWNASPHVSGTVPSPTSPGTYQDMWINGLSPNTTYYFAMKVRDEAGDHWSKLSNVVQAHTLGGGECCFSARRSGTGETVARAATAAQALGASRDAEAASSIGSSQALVAEFSRSSAGLSWLVYRLDSQEASGLAAGVPESKIIMQLGEGNGWVERAEGSVGTEDSLLSLHVPAADHGRFVFPGDFSLIVASEGAHGMVIEAADHSRLGSMIEELAPATGEFEIGSTDSLLLVYITARDETNPAAGFLTMKRAGSRSVATTRQTQTQPPKAFALAQNRPNPFAGTTRIQFDLPRDEHVLLEVFDLFGRRVAVLADRRFAAGAHAVEWDRQASAGGRALPGVYVYRMRAAEFRAQRKLVLLP